MRSSLFYSSPVFVHICFYSSVFFVSSISFHPFLIVVNEKREKKRMSVEKKHQYCYILCKIREKFSGVFQPPDPPFKFCTSLKSCTSVFAHFPKKCTSDGAHPMSKNRCATPTIVVFPRISATLCVQLPYSWIAICFRLSARCSLNNVNARRHISDNHERKHDQCRNFKSFTQALFLYNSRK